MTSGDIPFVLIVDDRPEGERSKAAVISASGVLATVRAPADVTVEDIKRAALIAVDEYLLWPPDMMAREPAFLPVDGLALIRVLQRRAWMSNVSPVFVLRSADLDTLGESLPAAIREPALAMQHDLDWAFRKQDKGEGRRIVALAAARYDLQSSFESGAPWDGGSRWLGITPSSWSEAAMNQVQACRPPEHAVAAYTGGAAWLRWFAQRILPFPGILLSDLHTALRLRLRIKDFHAIVKSGSPLASQLETLRYKGHLHDFLGDRWWRAGVDTFIDSLLADAEWDVPEHVALASKLSAIHGLPIEAVSDPHPVITIDVQYKESTEVIDASKAVRLSPDLWPVFADEPWADMDDALQEADLEALVARAERHRLDEAREQS
ncbi:hypothetical protein [Planobispora longispora]|uniref:Uncharacterized protein n=1 Tax=Planobispora longispora TaxID=28887 RepID=A0A8J3W792_9ACTN|nr:hypothetical protein [Planobispora longispora]BFE83818.1 hypothetical protein GCM10020093_064190 [Planobispora longispora]GIH78348.1 hypothetical protein Plo01_47770 [Planobispora longispora]